MKKVYCDRCGEFVRNESKKGEFILATNYEPKTDVLDKLLDSAKDYCPGCKKIIAQQILDSLHEKKEEVKIQIKDPCYRAKEDYDIDSDDSHCTTDLTEYCFLKQGSIYKIQDHLTDDIKAFKYCYNDKGDNRQEAIEFIKGSNFKYNYPCSDGSLLIADYGREFVINPEDIIVKLKNDCVQIYDPKEFKSTFETETTNIR